MTNLARQVILILGLALALGLLYWSWVDRIRLDERQKTEQRLQAAWEKKLRAAEAQAQDQLVTLRNQHVQALHGIDLQLRAALRELRNRPSRSTRAPTPSPADPAPRPTACTGAELAREDAEFLVREAAAAAEQQSRLVEALGAYSTCRRTLEEVTNGTHRKSSSP